MANLFFSGELQLSVTGPAAGIKDVLKAITKNTAAIVIEYEEDDIPSMFYIYPEHMQSGEITFKTDKKIISCEFSGVAKVPVAPSVVNWLVKKNTPFFAIGINGAEGWMLRKIGEAETCSLHVSAKAP